MSNFPYLFVRNSVYYYRRVLPKEISDQFHAKEIKFSLHTKNKKEAKKMIFFINFAFDTKFLPQVKINTNEKLMNSSLVELIEDMSKMTYTKKEMANISQSQEENKLQNTWNLNSSCTYTLCTSSANGGLNTKNITFNNGFNQLNLSNNELNQENCNEFGDKDKMIAYLLQKLQQLETKQDASICSNNTSETSKKSYIRKSDKHDWKTVFEEYAHYSENIDGYRANVIEEKRPHHEIMFELLGSPYLEDVDTDKVKLLLDQLKGVPRNCRKIYPQRKIIEAIRLAKRDGKSKLAIRTIKKYLSDLRCLFDYAINNKIIKINANPVPREGLSFGNKRATQKLQKRSRYPLFEEELDLLFNTNDFYQLFYRDTDLAYIMLIGALHGMRLNEICQLTTSDIIEKDGILLFDIKEDPSANKRTKNASSERQVPIHPYMKKFGFIDYVNKIKTPKKDKPLFNCKMNDRGYHSDAISKRFRYYRKKVKVLDNGKCFHSFRHTFTCLADMNGIPSTMIHCLTGWTTDTPIERSSRNSDMKDTYANEYSIKKKYEAIKKIKCESIENFLKFLKEKQENQ